MSRTRNFLSLLTLTICVPMCEPAAGADIKVLSVSIFKKAMDTLAPTFEQTSGHRVVAKYGSSNDVTKAVAAGEMYDVILAWPAIIESLTNEGKLAPGTRTDLARAATAVAVRKGAPKPDISSIDGFKRALLAAQSISFSADGESGLYFKSALEKLGIAGQMTAKLRPVPGGPVVVGPVAKGEVEMAVISIQFIRAEPGAELVGELPKGLEHYTVYTGAISGSSSNVEAANALLRHITSPLAANAINSTGVDFFTK